MAYKARVSFSFGDAIERAIPFDLQASSGDAGAAPWKLVLELAVPQGVVAEGGIPGFGGSGVRVYRGVGEGILGIVAAAVVV